MDTSITHLKTPYFQSVTWSLTAARATLAAMKAVATLGGTRPLDAISREMLEATRDYVFRQSIEIDKLKVISPQVLLRQLPWQRQRQEALQLILLMPYMDGKVEPAEVEWVQAFAAALDLNPATLKNLQRVCSGNYLPLLAGYGWRAFHNLFRRRGLRKKLNLVIHSAHQYYGDAEVAQRYQALEGLPDGTLGRELVRYYRDRNFPLPGEKKSFSEYILAHDLLHLLTDIGTDPEGEITLGGFEAGMSQSEFGFELLLEVILDFHLGVEMMTMGVVEVTRDRLNPRALMRAYGRGRQMPVDLLDPDWDFAAVWEQPIEALRQRYEVPGEWVVRQPVAALVC